MLRLDGLRQDAPCEKRSWFVQAIGFNAVGFDSIFPLNPVAEEAHFLSRTI